jgi:hypothetical protein
LNCTKENWGKRHTLDWRAMADDYNLGLSLDKLAAKYGMSAQSIRAVFKRRNVEVNKPGAYTKEMYKCAVPQ